MKKRALIFSFLLLFSLTFILAQNIECAEGDASCKINKARSCLNEKIDDRGCSVLSSEERVFSLLAVGECKNEVKSDSKLMSDVKFTAQAILALKNSGSSVSSEKEWLISQNRTSTGLNWFLEIDSPRATKCSVSYSNANQVNFGDDKKITSLSGGSCLRPSQGGYWLIVSPDCYDEEFAISCDEQFLTTLLYQKQGSDTIFVSEATHSSSSEGTTTEKVNSFCFGQGNSCDYEATLWSALVLSSLGEDVDSYLSYLAAMMEDNENLFPEAFLYFLTGNVDFRNQLLSKQINNKWWVSLNDKFYGTALALFALQFEEPPQKTGSLNWLFNEAQNEEGCWDSGNIRNTAFILYSLAPKSLVIDSGGGGIDCESAGYYCSSQINCPGSTLSGYSCSGAFVCCSEDTTITCSEQGGEICNSNQNCIGVGSLIVEASDLSLGQSCCLSGVCQEPKVTASACELGGGTCKVSGCSGNEEETFAACDFSSDVCCIQKPQQEKTSSLLVWVLGGLIILVVLAIIFREKLRPYWIRFKPKFGGSKPSARRKPGFPPPSAHRMIPGRRPPPRRIIPLQQRRSIPGKSSRASSKGEIDDVLKKLKEMSK